MQTLMRVKLCSKSFGIKTKSENLIELLTLSLVRSVKRKETHEVDIRNLLMAFKSSYNLNAQNSSDRPFSKVTS